MIKLQHRDGCILFLAIGREKASGEAMQAGYGARLASRSGHITMFQGDLIAGTQPAGNHISVFERTRWLAPNLQAFEWWLKKLNLLSNSCIKFGNIKCEVMCYPFFYAISSLFVLLSFNTARNWKLKNDEPALSLSLYIYIYIFYVLYCSIMT
jgi:hypothetical protein